jgi:hypothetical protein
MKKIDLGQTIQLLANVGVVGGLIFVGLQLRQDRELAAIEGVAIAQASRTSWAALISDGDNSQVWFRGLNGDPLSPAEQVEFEALAVAFEMNSFGTWYRATQLDTPRAAYSIAVEVAGTYADYPPLWELKQRRMAEGAERNERVGEIPQRVGWDEQLIEIVDKLRRQADVQSDFE